MVKMEKKVLRLVNEEVEMVMMKTVPRKNLLEEP